MSSCAVIPLNHSTQSSLIQKCEQAFAYLYLDGHIFMYLVTESEPNEDVGCGPTFVSETLTLRCLQFTN